MRTFHRWGGLIFIVSDFLNWMVIHTLSYWMKDFLSSLQEIYSLPTENSVGNINNSVGN